MEQDQEACREYTSYPIEVLGSLGYSGLPANVYAQMTSLTGESILSFPDSIVPSKSKKGSYDVVLPGESVSSPTLTLESNQLIPACGGYVVKLGLWLEGLNIPKLLPEFDSFTIGDAVRANAMTDLPPQRMKRFSIGKGWKMLSVERLMDFCKFKRAPVLARLPPQVFPRERGDLAREQAKRISLIGKANSQEDLRQMLIDEPTQELQEDSGGADRDRRGGEGARCQRGLDVPSCE